MKDIEWNPSSVTMKMFWRHYGYWMIENMFTFQLQITSLMNDHKRHSLIKRRWENSTSIDIVTLCGPRVKYILLMKGVGMMCLKSGDKCAFVDGWLGEWYESWTKSGATCNIEKEVIHDDCWRMRLDVMAASQSDNICSHLQMSFRLPCAYP